MARGGSQRVAEALAKAIVDRGGTIETGTTIHTVAELPPARTVILDLMPRAAIRIGGDRVSPRARRRLSGRKIGPAVFKVDWALDAPIPWGDEWSPRAGTVHVGGTWEQVAESEAKVHAGSHPDRPFVLVAQQSRFDPTRAPAGKQTAWGYCHVPSGSDVDMTDAVEAQIERYAPGFRDLIIGRHTMNAAQIEGHNPNYIQGDIAGGGFGLRKVFQLGATAPYRIGDSLYLCSSATPPGAGVHGMCGYYAARAALRDSSD
jgi:phytoene dehydrogenase-like protein